MKLRSLVLMPLLLLLGSPAMRSAPVLYTFNYYASGSGARLFGFQVVAPSFIVDGGPTLVFEQSQILNPYANYQSKYLAQVMLGQQTNTSATPPYTIGYLNMRLDSPDPGAPGGEPTLIISTFGNGPGQPNVYLDREGTYSPLFLSSTVFGAGQLVYSVVATPEPSTAGIVALALAAAALLALRRRTTLSERPKLRSPAA